jgi:hypothetical protein
MNYNNQSLLSQDREDYAVLQVQAQRQVWADKEDGVLALKHGDESPSAGRASFYRLRYGRYLIGMNANHCKHFA